MEREFISVQVNFIAATERLDDRSSRLNEQRCVLFLNLVVEPFPRPAETYRRPKHLARHVPETQGVQVLLLL